MHTIKASRAGFKESKMSLKPSSCCTGSQTFPVAVTHLPQFAKSQKQELQDPFLGVLGNKDGLLCVKGASVRLGSDTMLLAGGEYRLWTVWH